MTWLKFLCWLLIVAAFLNGHISRFTPLFLGVVFALIAIYTVEKLVDR